jgi:hypothetical protein
MPVRRKEKTLKIILEFFPISENSVEMAQVEFTGRPHAADYAIFVHSL